MKNILSSILAIAILGLVVSCGDDVGEALPGGASGSNTGQGGSLARFEIANNHLYIADQNRLLYYDLADPAEPVLGGSYPTGWTMETLFARDDQTLFSGNQQGMAIFNIENGEPVLLDTYTHILSCDPVVANDNTAYVTLNATGGCQGVNQMDVLDISTLTNISPITSMPMTSPRGLALAGHKLYVCDDGIKRYSIANDPTPLFEKRFEMENALDLIPFGGYFFVSTPSGFSIVDLTGDELKYVGNLW